MWTDLAALACAALAAARRSSTHDVPADAVQAALLEQGADLGARVS